MYIRDNKGILIFNDKGGKFRKNKNNLKILTAENDIIVGTQDKNGKPVALTFEISESGTLDRNTFERAEGATVLYAKIDYEKTPTDQVFSIARGFRNICSTNIRYGRKEKYIALIGIERETISKEEYYDVDYYENIYEK
ncbi:MAG TPA: hypothetical protein DDY98_03710 [Ruminococcaceae bacterium]|nr:hypothetical protein [Oscillospiraceae bacterium]